LKTPLLVAGLVIALIGIGIIPYHSENQTTTQNKAIHYDTNVWSISSYLEEGDNVTVIVRENALWIEGPFDIAEDGVTAVMYMFIDFIDPNGNITTFEVDLAILDVYGQQRLFNWNMNVLEKGSIDTNSMLDDKGRLTAVGGTIPFSGTYTAYVTVAPDREDQPPSFLGFYHMEMTTIYPNSYLLPTGIAIIGLGGYVSFFGVITGKHRISRRSQKK